MGMINKGPIILCVEEITNIPEDCLNFFLKQLF